VAHLQLQALAAHLHLSVALVNLLVMAEQPQ
jgi:hypothetical protein